uniref:Acylphosphatase n=1 Tax=candidate division WOR-3 bacterium TaxID=2052148 RepID=A0A7C3NEJ1_UNCW3
MKTYEILVKGYVQGVGFRYFVQRLAKKIGVKGYVKNLFSGDVLIIAQGENFQLEDFIKRVKIEHPHAEVNEMLINQIESSEFDDFTIEY